MIIHEQFAHGGKQSGQKPAREWVPFDQIIGGPVSESRADVIYLRPEFEGRTSKTEYGKKSVKSVDLKLGATKAVLWIMTICGMGLYSGMLFEMMNVF